MSLNELGIMLRIINNNGGFNPDGRCQAISVRTAKVLIGTDLLGPVADQDDIAHPVQDRLVYNGFNENALLNYFQQAPMGSVFRAESENHAWNFIKDYYATIHIIDVSCWNFITVKNTNDLIANFRQEPQDPQLPFNYGNGALFYKNSWHPDEDYQLFLWGTLTIRWSQFLRPQGVLN